MNNIILVTTTTWCFWEVIPIPNGAERTSWWATRCNLRGAFKCSLRQRERPLHWVQQSLVVLWVKAKRCQASWQRTVPTEWPVNHLPPVFWKRAKKADCLSVETWNCSPSSECPSSLIPSHIRRWFFLYLWTSHLCLQRAKAEINNWLKQERKTQTSQSGQFLFKLSHVTWLTEHSLDSGRGTNLLYSQRSQKALPATSRPRGAGKKRPV